MAGLSDEDGVLELRGSLPICGDCGPVIRPSDVFMNASVDHGFYSEDVAGFHEPRGFIVSIVGYIRSDVELFANAMPTICLVDCQSKLCNMYPFYSIYFDITLPTSLYIVPGLHISKAFCKHS